MRIGRAILLPSYCTSRRTRLRLDFVCNAFAPTHAPRQTRLTYPNSASCVESGQFFLMASPDKHWKDDKDKDDEDDDREE